jgi:hypothetical protein
VSTLASIAGLVSFTLLAACHAQGGVRSPVEAQVLDAADRFDRAQLENDRTTIDGFLAADFVFVRGSGKVTGRDSFLETFGNPSTKLEPFEILNRKVIVLGPDAAIVAAEAWLRGTENGERFEEHFWFSDTFQRRDGRWQVVYTQVTMIK